MTQALGLFSKTADATASTPTNTPKHHIKLKLKKAKNARKRKDAFSPTWFSRRFHAVKSHIRFTHKQVFEAFMSLLVFHAILTLEAFYDRVKHCQTTPANWIMLFMDKIHAVYRDRDGTTLMDDGETDPVAMTVAGLLPKGNRGIHHPTDAARQLFAEIMMEFLKAEKGEKSRWAGKVSAPAITLELGRRKGKGKKK